MSAFWSANSQHAALPRIGVVELFSQHAILANGVRSDSSDSLRRFGELSGGLTYSDDRQCR